MLNTLSMLRPHRGECASCHDIKTLTHCIYLTHDTSAIESDAILTYCDDCSIEQP